MNIVKERIRAKSNYTVQKHNGKKRTNIYLKLWWSNSKYLKILQKATVYSSRQKKNRKREDNDMKGERANQVEKLQSFTNQKTK